MSSSVKLCRISSPLHHRGWGSPCLPLYKHPQLLCLKLPSAPQTVVITVVHWCEVDPNRAASVSENRTFPFFTMQANVELRSCGTFARCQKSSFVLLQPLGTDLTQLVILHNPCHVGWDRHTETHFQISIQSHTGLQAQITHETRLKLITWVCRYDISLGCDCSNIMDEIELCCWNYSD